MPTVCQTPDKVKILTPTQAVGGLGVWYCWGVHTHFPEIACIHGLLEKAEGGLRELSLGSRGEYQGSYPHGKVLCALNLLWKKILTCLC